MLTKCQSQSVCSLNNAIWRHKSGSILVQVLACCLNAKRHYLNQCWLTAIEILWHPFEDNVYISIPNLCLKFTHSKSQPHSPGDSELKEVPWTLPSAPTVRWTDGYPQCAITILLWCIGIRHMVKQVFKLHRWSTIQDMFPDILMAAVVKRTGCADLNIWPIN